MWKLKDAPACYPANLCQIAAGYFLEIFLFGFLLKNNSIYGLIYVILHKRGKGEGL